MNHRERALAAMRGQPVDHIPFIARMDLWYSYHKNQDSLPHPYEKASLWDIQRDLGIGIFGFGAWDISFYRLIHRNVEVVKTVRGQETMTHYVTPYGSLTARDVMAEELKEAAGTGGRLEYPFKSEADYNALQYLIEITQVVENFEAYAQFIDAIGEDGIALPFSGHLPAHQLMIFFMGYQRFYYELNDHLTRLEALIQALENQQQQVLTLAAASPADAIEAGGNYDEQMTPPPVFERFFAPFYRKASQLLAPTGKPLVIHGDGEMRKLLTNLMSCGIQVVETITPKPMTSIDVAPGDRFILGFGDNVPTDASFERVKRIAHFWMERGHYPVSVQ
jgi:hypothetical protein